MSYTRVNWQDGESGNTPISAENLNKMDEQIYNNTVSIETNLKNVANNTTNIETLSKKVETKQDVIICGTSLPDTVVNGQVFLLYS